MLYTEWIWNIPIMAVTLKYMGGLDIGIGPMARCVF